MITAHDLLKTEFITAEVNDQLSSVMGKIKDEAFAEVLVFKGKKFAGMFSPVFATKSKIDMINTKVDKFLRPATCVEEDTDLDELMVKMIASDYNCLPVKRDDEVIGVVHIFDLLNSIGNDLKNLKISDINLQKGFTVKEKEGISKAIHLLQDNSVRALVIMDEKDIPTGILSHFDVMRNIHLYSHERDFGQKHKTSSKAFKADANKLGDLPVSNFIQYKKFVSVVNKDSVTNTIKTMIKNKILNLLVKDNGSIIEVKNMLGGIEVEHKATTEFVGLKDLTVDNFIINNIKNVAQKYADKFGQMLNNTVKLKVHIKQYKSAQADKKHKYSIKVHLIFPGDIISIDRSAEWDLKLAVQKAMKDTETRIKHVFSN